MDKDRAVRGLLRKMEHHDADERFMAVHDLVKQLNSPEDLSPDLQSQVRETVVRLLEDRSPDVSTMATKCLTVLVQRFEARQSVLVVERLGGLISGEEDPEEEKQQQAGQASYHRPAPPSAEDLQASRETWADGLKGLVAAMDGAAGLEVAPRLCEKLVGGMAARRAAGKAEPALDMLTLSILRDLLLRFGDALAEREESLLAELLPLMDHEDFYLRERAGGCVGALAPTTSDENYKRVLDVVVDRICAGGSDTALLQTYIQTANLVTHSAGLRVAPYLERLVPRLTSLLSPPQGTGEEEDDAAVLLREQCLRTLEGFVTSCPQAVTQYLDQVKDRAVAFLAYDPNLAAPDAGGDEDPFGGDGDGDVDMGGWGDDDDDAAAAGWGDEEDGAGGAAGDDAGWGDEAAAAGGGDLLEQSGDISWKVRRASVGVLRAFVNSRGDVLRSYYGEFMGLLLSRFAEREAAVKLDVLGACCDLLRAAVVAKREVDRSHDRRLAVPVITRQRSSYDTLSSMVEDIVEAVRREFAAASVEVKRALYAVLRELLVVRGRGGSLARYLDGLVPEVLAGVRSSHEGMKADALSLLHHVLEFHTPEHLAKFVGDAAEAVCASVAADDVPKTKGDALRILGALAGKVERGSPASAALIGRAFEAVLGELAVKDADEQVKEGSLAAAAAILARFGDALPRAGEAVAYMSERVDNRVSRVAALEALTAVARSDLGVDLGVVTAEARVEAVARLMRKKGAATRHATAVFLAALVERAAAGLSDAACGHAVSETLPHLGPDDLQLADVVMRLYTALAAGRPGAAASLAASADLTGRLLGLARDPLVQGHVLASLIDLYAALGRGLGREPAADALRDSLAGSVGAEAPSTVQAAVSRCVAAVTLAVESRLADDVQRYSAVVSSGADDGQRLMALLTLGEVGRARNLGEVPGFDGVAVCSGAFQSPAKAVRDAAAAALGRLAVGGARAYLPSITERVAAGAAGQHLLLFLTALREALAGRAAAAEPSGDADMDGFAAHVPALAAALLGLAGVEEEGPRDVVAECLGRLAAAAPAEVVPALGRLAAASEAAHRRTAVAAARHALSPASRDLLAEAAPALLALASDADLGVRREALVTVTHLARLDAALLDPHLQGVVLPAVYRASAFDKSLVEEVDFGAFVEKRDHGLPLRISAFEAMERVVAEAPHRVDMAEFVRHLGQGLAEESPDVQLVAYRVLHALADDQPSRLLETLDTLPALITRGVKPKLKQAQAKNGQRAQAVLHAVVVTVLRIHALPGVQQCTGFCKFKRQVMVTKQLKAIASELESAEAGASA